MRCYCGASRALDGFDTRVVLYRSHQAMAMMSREERAARMGVSLDQPKKIRSPLNHRPCRIDKTFWE